MTRARTPLTMSNLTEPQPFSIELTRSLRLQRGVSSGDTFVLCMRARRRHDSKLRRVSWRHHSQQARVGRLVSLAFHCIQRVFWAAEILALPAWVRGPVLLPPWNLQRPPRPSPMQRQAVPRRVRAPQRSEARIGVTLLIISCRSCSLSITLRFSGGVGGKGPPAVDRASDRGRASCPSTVCHPFGRAYGVPVSRRGPSAAESYTRTARLPWLAAKVVHWC
jgi:hypothetical protein